jgi:hypothetical protein
MSNSRPTLGIVGGLAMAFLMLASCGSGPKIAAKGTLSGEVIETTVDSEAARYYLESYLQGKKGDPGLDRKIDALTHRYEQSLPSREELKVISSEFSSTDFAALFFAERLLSRECNRSVNRSFSRYRIGRQAPRVDPAAYMVLFVPGWDYVENGPVTGADFARPRKLATEFGLENYLVPLPPTGSVEENAVVVAAEVTKRSASGKKILLAGASSAGPAIHLALGELIPKKELGSIKAWLNLGGILQGSPLVDHFQRRPQVWLFDLVVWGKGWSRDAMLGMGTVPSRKRFERLRVDENILMVNYLGIPLSGQLSRYSEDKYPLLKPEGPNDGLTLLSDVIAPNSVTIVALGSDHFFAEDPNIDEKTVALMTLIISLLESGTSARCTSIDSR